MEGLGMPEKTMQEAARELHLAVVALRELIAREYPSRREVERRFVSREQQQKRWAVTFVLIVIASILSFVTTVATVSGCFLGDQEKPGVCRILPGYQNHFDRRERIDLEHEQLRQLVEQLENKNAKKERK